MEDSKIFKNIWRVNAIIIMIVGILGVALTLFACIMTYKDITRDRSVRNIVNITESPEDDENWRLGRIIPITGSNLVMMPLESDQSYSGSSYNKHSSSIRNFLFIDIIDDKQYWLFQNNDYLITQTSQLPKSAHSEKKEETKALLYYIVKSDTNNDSTLASSDLLTIALSKPNGEGYVEILENIDFVNDYDPINEKSVLLVFQKNNVGFSAKIDLESLSISNPKELPSIQH